MNWEAFIFILVAGLFFCMVVILLETSSMAEKSVKETVLELWHTFFGKGKGN